jgi:hypothetical protein
LFIQAFREKANDLPEGPSASGKSKKNNGQDNCFLFKVVKIKSLKWAKIAVARLLSRDGGEQFGFSCELYNRKTYLFREGFFYVTKSEASRKLKV